MMEPFPPMLCSTRTAHSSARFASMKEFGIQTGEGYVNSVTRKLEHCWEAQMAFKIPRLVFSRCELCLAHTGAASGEPPLDPTGAG